MVHVFLFFIVTKQRDPETGQQSLLFQVSVFVGNPYVKSVDLTGFGCFGNIVQTKQIHIKAPHKRVAIKLSSLLKLSLKFSF